MKKFLVLAVCAVLAMIALPATAASAKPANGNVSGCASIHKHGRYNAVQAGVLVGSVGKSLRVRGYVAVTKHCQKANSVPISRISIYHARLKDARTGQVLRLSGGESTHKHSIVSSKTSYKYASCGRTFIASAKIGYAYTDGSKVRPFFVHGRVFRRC